MKPPNRQREIQLKFRVTPEERELIEQKMEQLGTTNMAAYLRKMAMDGYAVNLELPELRYPSCAGPATTSTSLPAVSMRQAGSMTRIWRS